jgi:N-acyl-D-amino-acid deacylase
MAGIVWLAATRRACDTARRVRTIAGFISILASLAMTSLGCGPRYDLVVRNGTVIDGSGAKRFRADVAINGGRIVRVGEGQRWDAVRSIDARGLAVGPGFIDVHTHADDIAEKPSAENFIRMGVTTVVAGNCGDSALRLGEALAAIKARGVALNFATLVGHNTVRQAVMGTERRAPTPDELQRMKGLVAQAMAEGAVGFSTGLQYVPGTYADRAEIIELTRAAGAAGGIYATHMRNEGTRVEEAVAEAIAVGEAAGCPVEISHLKIDSPNRWGASTMLLGLIDDARKRGVQVRADQYAYTAASAGLSIRFPAWALEGGREKINARLDDERTWRQIKGEIKGLLAERGFEDLSWAVVASYRADPSLDGLSIKQVAAKVKGKENADAQLEVARDMIRGGDPQMIYHFMSEDDVARIMRHPQVAVASDSDVLTPGVGVPHPRGYGNNARVLGRYVRELKLIPLEEAVRKMTSLPASQFRFADRGLIKEGYAADLVIFDPGTVSDRATFEQPHQFPVGIPDVIVNGKAVIEQGRDTGARPGQIVRMSPAPRPVALGLLRPPRSR